jgi:hypothetical protein
MTNIQKWEKANFQPMAKEGTVLDVIPSSSTIHNEPVIKTFKASKFSDGFIFFICLLGMLFVAVGAFFLFFILRKKIKVRSRGTRN